jgi:mannose-6-phosphate isomerase-like protein (cupin superfamily)
MENSPNTSALPANEARRHLTHARPDQDGTLPHVGMAGDTYTILLTGKDTAGRYCLSDMHVPPDGGPAPHRHDFEEMFTVLEGEIEATFRGQRGRTGGRDHQHPGQRSPRLHERFRQAGTAGLPMLADPRKPVELGRFLTQRVQFQTMDLSLTYCFGEVARPGAFVPCVPGLGG